VEGFYKNINSKIGSKNSAIFIKIGARGFSQSARAFFFKGRGEHCLDK
jgi:hypothetical protein